jgi:RNA polymerase sigma-B factor
LLSAGSAAQAGDAELLARARAGDAQAREQIVARYLPLARQLARRYQHADEPLDDLIQVASLGLVKAVDRFDLERDVAFSSYAVPTIVGELKRHFRDRTWSLRVPRELQEMVLRTDRAVAQLAVDLHRQPTVSEIAAALGTSEEQVLEALAAAGAYRAGSLDAPRPRAEHEEGDSLGDALGVDEEGFDDAETRATLGPLLARISKRERLVLRLRFAEDMTQAEIGEQIGVSQMQVSRLIRQSLARLRSVSDGGEAPGGSRR